MLRGTKGRPPTQSWQIQEGFLEEVTSKMRPEGRGGARETTKEKQGRGGPSKGPKTRGSW